MIIQIIELDFSPKDPIHQRYGIFNSSTTIPVIMIVSPVGSPPTTTPTPTTISASDGQKKQKLVIESCFLLLLLKITFSPLQLLTVGYLSILVLFQYY